MIRKSPIIAVLLSIMLLCTGCSKRKSASSSYYEPMEESYAAPAAAAMGDSLFYADSGSAAYEVADYDQPVHSEEAKTQESAVSATAPSDSAVRKIIYNADMSATADDPGALRDRMTAKAAELGGYVSSSSSKSGDDGVTSVSLQLKVPADRLEELVETANGLAKVTSYRLYSDDISQRYYDIQARLSSAKAEEAQLTEILKQCETVEEILMVRESLASVRADIESYQGTINLWDHLVSYATLDLSIRRTPKTAVETTDDPVPLWKFSDVWHRMQRGFVNSARIMVNAVGAIGIFLAVALIPIAILFLAIGLPIILHVRKKRRAKSKEAMLPGHAPEGSESNAASDVSSQE